MYRRVVRYDENDIWTPALGVKYKSGNSFVRHVCRHERMRMPIADCRVRMQKPVVRAIFYDSKCYTFGLKKSAKKFENNLHVTKICRYFAPASMRGMPL